jgi:hypothetical protein
LFYKKEWAYSSWSDPHCTEELPRNARRVEALHRNMKVKVVGKDPYDIINMGNSPIPYLFI